MRLNSPIVLIVALQFASCGVSSSFAREADVQVDRSADAAPPDGSLVLQRLVQYDSIYRSGLAASAVQRRTDPIRARGPFLMVTAEWRLTFEGDRAGYVMNVTDRENPVYVPPSERASGPDRNGIDAAQQEAMHVAMRISDWGYWGTEASGNHYVDASLKVTPDGNVTQVGTIYDTSLYPPGDLSPIAALSSFQWALGRFFSDRLDKVTAVEESADGRLRVEALGTRYAGAPGRWVLEIETDAAWMVRKAVFHPESDPDRVKAEMTNDGMVWSGPYCIPVNARVNFFGPVEDIERSPATRTQQLAFDPVVGGFDEDFYNLCEQEVMHGDEPALTVTDLRVTPPRMTKPNRESRQPTAIEQKAAAAGPLRQWIVVANLIALCAFVIVMYVRRKRKTSTPVAPHNARE